MAADLAARKEASVLKGETLIGAPQTAEMPVIPKSRRERADLSPAKNSAGARMKNADSAAEKSLLIEKKAALKNALTTVILKDKTAARAITAESPT